LYDYYVKLMPHRVQSQVHVTHVDHDGEDARRKLETAFMGLIAARRASVGDPAVYVNGERLREPTSTSVGNTNVSDDSAEAVRLLQEMAEKQGRKFEDVFADPNNTALAGRTHTGAHRPTSSSTSGSELQR
jgi:hypothetical protein